MLFFTIYGDEECGYCKGTGIRKVYKSFFDRPEEPCEICNGTGVRKDTLLGQYREQMALDAEHPYVKGL